MALRDFFRINRENKNQPEEDNEPVQFTPHTVTDRGYYTDDLPDTETLDKLFEIEGNSAEAGMQALTFYVNSVVVSGEEALKAAFDELYVGYGSELVQNLGVMVDLSGGLDLVKQQVGPNKKGPVVESDDFKLSRVSDIMSKTLDAYANRKATYIKMFAAVKENLQGTEAEKIAAIAGVMIKDNRED